MLLSFGAAFLTVVVIVVVGWAILFALAKLLAPLDNPKYPQKRPGGFPIEPTKGK